MPSHLLAFALASAALAMLPGPNTLFIAATSIVSGRRAGVASVLGTNLGTAAYAVATAFGLAAVLTASAIAFSVVKYAGAAYLFWLGLRTLLAARRSSSSDDGSTANVMVRSPSQTFRQAFIIGVTNPKVALFFVSFFPQFLVPGRNHVSQSLVLGATFLVIAMTSDSCVALIAGVLADRRRTRREAQQLAGTVAARVSRPWGKYASAAVYFALGIFAASTGHPRAS